jgi:hypothetical protein
LIGPGAAGSQASNIFVDRLLADAGYAAQYQSELEQLTTELYESGVASEVPAEWVALLERSNLVDAGVLVDEAASISRFFA